MFDMDGHVQSHKLRHKGPLILGPILSKIPQVGSQQTPSHNWATLKQKCIPFHGLSNLSKEEYLEGLQSINGGRLFCHGRDAPEGMRACVNTSQIRTQLDDSEV